MSAVEIIEAIQKGLKIHLSTRERNWIKDNVVKRRLQVVPDNLIIGLSEIESMSPSNYIIIQNGKSRKLRKFNPTHHAIVVNYSGLCRVFQPE